MVLPASGLALVLPPQASDEIVNPAVLFLMRFVAQVGFSIELERAPEVIDGRSIHDIRLWTLGLHPQPMARVRQGRLPFLRPLEGLETHALGFFRG